MRFRRRSGLRFLILLIFSLVASGLGPAPGKAPAFVTADEPEEPLVPGARPVKRHDVYDLKTRLKELGLYSGPIDETYDAAATEAVKRFQRTYWLDETGIVEASTWRALGHGIRRPARAAAGSPPEGAITVEVNTEQLTLTLLVGGKPWRTYPVAAGRWETMTPVGEWRIVEKGYKGGGAFGSRWMGLDVPWGSYGIHGTNMPWTIGGYYSTGCIRMFDEDVVEVFGLVAAGTLVKVIGYRPSLDFGRAIAPGSTSPEVVALQQALRENGFDAGRCDGVFGAVTEARVEEVAALYGLPYGVSRVKDVLTILGVK